MLNGPSTHPPAAVHLDLDGARHIYRVHGWPYDHPDDPLFESGLTAALELFARQSIRATLFVVAEDVHDPGKRRLVEQAVTAGHEIASHSTSHRHLTRLAPAERAYEIAESRRILSSTLGVPVTGFRAPGLRVNHACLAAVRDAGYDYDSSVLAGARRPGDGPYAPLPGQALVELPIPATSRLGLPFHPSYSLVVGDWYFRRSLHAFGRRDSPFILLFHLTDFAEPLEPTRARSWQQRLFTLSHLAASRKRARCAAALDLVKQRYRLATTADLTSYASQPDARGRRTS